MSYKNALILGFHDCPGGNREEFEHMAGTLRKQGITPLLHFDLFDGLDDSTLKEVDALRVIAAFMLDGAAMVVTLNDWEKVPLNNQLVMIARMCHIPVEPFTKFISASVANG